MNASQVRASWLCRVNNAAQVLIGAIAAKEVGAIGRALLVFERRCPPPATMAERLVIRGIIVETFLRLDTMLADWTSARQRAEARRRVHATPVVSGMDALLAPLRGLCAAAQQTRTLPLHERVRTWIDEHPDDARTIGDIATLLGAHPRTINRHFARHLGQTVQEYRWARRAARVRQLLAVSTLKVDAVAGAVGAASKATVYRILQKSGESVS